MIELSTVIALLLILVGVVVPRVVTWEQSNREREFWGGFNRLPSIARETAIRTGETVRLRLSDDQSQFVLQQDSANPNEPDATPTTVKSLSLLPGATANVFRKGTQDSQSNDWEVTFYSDGTCNGGGVTLVLNEQTRSLSVDRRGVGEAIRGPLPEVQEENWPAGEYEKRA